VATLEQYLTNALNSFFASSTTQAAIGNWSLAWGPVIFESQPSDTSYADNAMYVATNADNSVYVVGIAATNPNSDYDWTQEDLNVGSTTTWAAAFPSLGTYGVPSHSPTLNPYISAATQLGVNNLLGMVNGSQQSLVDFLGSIATSTSKNATLIFAGHSLAGALSPTIALALFNPAGGPLSLSNWQNVYVYATAGATPGNQDFSTFFNLVFPPTELSITPHQDYQIFNVDVWNSLDVVPHAWEISMLNEIETLYPVSWIIAPLKLQVAIAGLKNASNNGAATGAGPYTQLGNEELTGTFNSSIPVSDFDSFESQAVYQHTTAYDILIGIQSVLPTSFTQTVLSRVARNLLTTEVTKLESDKDLAEASA
jgi:hypothetical protein